MVIMNKGSIRAAAGVVSELERCGILIELERPEAPPPSGAAKPTIAGTVTPETPLDALNLNWRERDLTERERTKHVNRLHPYLGKFVPQLVEIFLRKYWIPGQKVLDPFCGSGTTLVQANELDIHAVGYDISAFNVLLCRAKMVRYDLDVLRREALDVLERLGRQCSGTRTRRGCGMLQEKSRFRRRIIPT
jgi:hypothetical protein